MYSLGMSTSLEVILVLLTLAFLLALCLSWYVFLRRAILTKQSDRDGPLSSTSRLPTNVRCVPQNVPGSWRILQDDQTVLEIAPLPGARVASGGSIAVPAALTTWWETISAKFPEVKRGIAKLGANSYRLKFHPEVARGLEEGTYNLMSAPGGGVRLNAVDRLGQVVGQGFLVTEPGSLLIQVPGLVWAVLSAVTFHKYLSDINKRLFRLERAMEVIQEWLDNLSQGEVEGNYRYLKHYVTS